MSATHQVHKTKADDIPTSYGIYILAGGKTIKEVY